MIVERVISEGLAHISYFVGSGKDAVVIDPRRDCDAYMKLAKREDMKIQYIFETHRHEDFVIGSLELVHLTGAKVYHGPGLGFKYGEELKDGDEFTLGFLKLRVIHTPGHTDESVCYALSDLTSGTEPVIVFTGDTLFVGDVGRTDLYGPEQAPRLAEALYESIFNKLLPLGDGVMIYPAHGAGSVCGGTINLREVSTLGLERIQNPALQKIRKDDFIEFKCSEQHERPHYFGKMEVYNLNGPPLLKQLPDPPPLSPKEFQKQMDDGAIVVDTRMPTSFGAAYIKGSYSIWLDGIPTYAGWVLTYDIPVLLVLENRGQGEKAVRYLVRLGYDKIAGYLCRKTGECGVELWYNVAFPMEHIGLLTVHELKYRLESSEDLKMLDVRTDKEWGRGHISGAIHIHVGNLRERINEIPKKDHPIVVLCGSGRRSSIGASILSRGGYQKIYNILGGMTAWRNAGYETVKD
ncbi:MAG: MBL fold metallo-hydrolase [Thermodesulfobacteriota bacterium]